MSMKLNGRTNWARTSRRRGSGVVRRSSVALALAIGGTACLTWLLLFPYASGAWGRWIAEGFFHGFGWAAYLLPILLGCCIVKFLFNKAESRILPALASTTIIFSVATLLALTVSVSAGGRMGNRIANLLVDGLGPVGSISIGVACLLASSHALFGIPWVKLSVGLLRILSADLKDWQRTRRELADQIERAHDSLPIPASECHMEAQALEGSHAAVRDFKDKVDKSILVEPSVNLSGKGYTLPPVSLLRAAVSPSDRGKPSESELRAAIEALETTLKNFAIDARVSRYAPGPVITRYELAPAPGVKVSSIVALENDIALAMKAKSIRIIAPIPGKAAVGIEIPNQRHAMVVLREIIESPALPPGAPLLSFALGLSAAGEPLLADLQQMPHLLIGGQTGSGKSAVIHALILSILFRSRPDEVKLLLIDPKRLELAAFYGGIPSLFDPTTVADRVAVITDSKDAAKSLNALVHLMEKRYERFQLFGVRNIDSYNKEADKRGQPREFFIVVVIDELANLMLVAKDSVEESIRRLTAMARAVGIHLVLATQRPSVDVITGVIKANLPCRIALQVIQKIDSKVILDCTGAESLQGKGDMLYLAAGAQKPERCQGAYVSEEEINAVVSHLKNQGKPNYPVLETMAAVAPEEDLEKYGIDLRELTAALKLVLERRRVSQDLLKSQFGSSARATNLLSLLEIKGFIHKPENSNKWQIHFDKIEEYLFRIGNSDPRKSHE